MKLDTRFVWLLGIAVVVLVISITLFLRPSKCVPEAKYAIECFPIYTFEFWEEYDTYFYVVRGVAL